MLYKPFRKEYDLYAASIRKYQRAVETFVKISHGLLGPFYFKNLPPVICKYQAMTFMRVIFSVINQWYFQMQPFSLRWCIDLAVDYIFPLKFNQLPETW